MFLIFGAVMWFIYAPSKSDKEKKESETGFNANIPAPKNDAIVADKKPAYEDNVASGAFDNEIAGIEIICNGKSTMLPKEWLSDYVDIFHIGLHIGVDGGFYLYFGGGGGWRRIWSADVCF